MKALISTRFLKLLTSLGVLLALLLSGCASSKPEANKRRLLGTNTIKGNKTVRSDELEALIPQKPNRRFLGLPLYPYLWLYRIGSAGYDKDSYLRRFNDLSLDYQQKARELENDPAKLGRIQKKYFRKINRAKTGYEKGNWWMRVLGEEPVYYNEAHARLNAEKMNGYLKSSGFFENTVGFESDTSHKRVKTTYTIHEGRPTMLRNIYYRSRDEFIDSLLKANASNGLLKSGKRYSGDAFEAERMRLETLLRDNGFYGFSRQYVNFTVNDTIRTPNDSTQKTVDVFAQIIRPSKSPKHLRYTLDSVYVDFLPVNSDELPFGSRKLEKNKIHYTYSGKRFSPNILNSMIRLRPGAQYSLRNERDTQRQLSTSDQFQFINFTFDTTGTRLVSHITAIPLDKYTTSTDVGLNVIQLQQTPGPFANLAFKARNVFNGMENFEVNLRGGIEAATGYTDTRLLYRSTELNFNTAINFPQLFFPVGSIRYSLGKYNPRTQLGIGYNYVDRPEYTRTNIKTSLTYTLQPSQQKLLSISLIDLNILDTRKLSSEFGQLLDTLELQGNNLKNSFRESFVSDINITYVYNTNSLLAPQKGFYFRGNLESGGTSLSLFPNQRKLINTVVNNDELQYYQYLRWSLDLRRYWPVNNRGAFVARVNTGAVHSYGITKDRIPPYEKYFFAGGSNSIRAWLPRRVGPGNASPQVTTNGLTIEAPGEFLFEGNFELRGYLMRFFGDIHYALFLDYGNVWRFPKPGLSNSAPGVLRLDSFARQMAVGTGFGVRYDLKYFVFRLDFGLKLYDPYYERFVLNDFKIRSPFNTRNANFLNVNLGVGYPF